MKFLKLFLLMTLFLTAGFEVALKNQSTILNPEEAFKVSAVENGDVIETKIILAKDVHVSDETLKYMIIKPKKFELKVKRPKAHEQDGDMVYSKDIEIDIPVADIASKIPKKSGYTLQIEFQGCADKGGICYSPIIKEYTFDAPKIGFFQKIINFTKESNSANIVDILKSESSFFVISLFFIFGLLLALTPCIFPMIPILSSIIVSQSGSSKPSAAKGFFTSLVYVLSMAVTYTILGIIAGVLGADIQSAMQNPWVLTTFAVIFFALALSLFGYYELQLPASWQSKIHNASDSAQGKGIIGTAIMGFLSAFIIGPCVAPPLAGAVIFISKTGDAFLGGMALFVMSIGMGLPLLLVGVGAGKFMPKPGGWMTRVSQVFGVVMLGLSIFMLSKVLPDWMTMALWSLLFMGMAIYMGVFNSNRTIEGATKLFQLLGFIFLLYGISLFIALLSGSTSMMHPFEKFTNPTVVKGSLSADSPVVTNNEISKSENRHLGYSIARLLKEVKESDKPVVVDFGKKSCASCRELEAITFPNPAVQAELKRFTFISIDVTENTQDDKDLLKNFDLFGTPNIIFFDKNNKFLPKKSLTGFIAPDVFVQHLKSID
jgi:thiol:disulfide interchange protein DsbD